MMRFLWEIDYDRSVPLRRNAKVELLKTVPLFARCSKKELSAIATEADELDVPAGRALVVEGQSGREFVVVVSGDVEVRKKGTRVNTLGDGDFFGEIALLTGLARTATVTTTSPCHLLVLTDRAFRRVTAAMPSVNEKVLQALADRLDQDAV
jgi:CRP/FNR family transcriptional regulator, cyclic AMP receptor protein